MPIKPRTIVYMKSTEEPCFILSIRDNLAEVRRPIQSQDGIRYEVAEFFCDELQTAEERARTIMEQQKLVQQVLAPGRDLLEELNAEGVRN